MISTTERPSHFRRDISIVPAEQDMASLTDLITHATVVRNEQYLVDLLHEVVQKPWGCESRVFADNYFDLWFLTILDGEKTSLHAHVRKITRLLCLEGTGIVTTLRGEYEIGPGSIVSIAAGAFHSTRSTSEHLFLIEVETPRNKFDLVRLRDAYERDTTHYEAETAQPTTSRLRRLPHLPGAVIRAVSPDARFRFDIRTGMDILYRPGADDLFYVPLGMRALLSQQIPILRPDGLRDELRGDGPQTSAYYLAIRAAR